MYKITKVKQWMKRSAKRKLMYNPGLELVSDTFIMLKVVPEMKPTILEIYGHFNGGSIQGWGRKEEYYTESMPDMEGLFKHNEDGRKIKDIGLRQYHAESKKDLRVLYFPDTGEKIFLDNVFAELFTDFGKGDMRLNGRTPTNPVTVSVGAALVGLLLPVRAGGNFHEDFYFKKDGEGYETE